MCCCYYYYYIIPIYDSNFYAFLNLKIVCWWWLVGDKLLLNLQRKLSLKANFKGEKTND